MVLGACSQDNGNAAIAVEAPAQEFPATTQVLPPPEPVLTTAPAPPIPITPPEQMPGDLIEFGPVKGDRLDVVGVSYSDVLNVRIAPSTDFDVIGTLDHDAAGITALGDNRLLPDSFWVQIDLDGSPGWVNERYVGYLGNTQSVETAVPAGEVTTLDLGRAVAAESASVEPPSEITVVAEPTDDVVVLDVIGLGDDAAKGFRITVTTEATADGRAVTEAQQQIICSRGITADGLCV